jgi:hypothetical protein
VTTSFPRRTMLHRASSMQRIPVLGLLLLFTVRLYPCVLFVRMAESINYLLEMSNYSGVFKLVAFPDV